MKSFEFNWQKPPPLMIEALFHQFKTITSITKPIHTSYDLVSIEILPENTSLWQKDHTLLIILLNEKDNIYDMTNSSKHPKLSHISMLLSQLHKRRSCRLCIKYERLGKVKILTPVSVLNCSTLWVCAICHIAAKKKFLDFYPYWWIHTLTIRFEFHIE